MTVFAVCGEPALASGQVEPDDSRIELPSPPTRKDRIELPTPPTRKDRIGLPSPPSQNGGKHTSVQGSNAGSCQNPDNYLTTSEYHPRRLVVYSYRRDPDVAYSDDEITERHNVRMRRHYLGDDGVWREHLVWVTKDFAARHGYSPDVKMTRHYYDRSGNSREHTVLVTREFAARWGYTPKQGVEHANATVARPIQRID